jgi:hypothetical protein
MLGNQFGGAIENALEIVNLCLVLEFNNDEFIILISNENIDTIVFVIRGVLIGFAFNDFDDLDRLRKASTMT